MKYGKFLHEHSNILRMSTFRVIPLCLIQETMDSEYIAASMNSNTYWDNFEPKISRSKVLKAQIDKNARVSGR